VYAISEGILGLGIIRELNYEREEVVIVTPIYTETGSLAAVNGIILGGMKLVTVNGRWKEFKSTLSPLSKSQTAENTDE
jgi:polynucleotide 5'-kinase involved in rRNA processing